MEDDEMRFQFMNSFNQNERNIINTFLKNIDKFSIKLSYSRIKKTMFWYKNKTYLTSECPICLKSIKEKSKCRILKCTHVFHDLCIQQWLM